MSKVTPYEKLQREIGAFLPLLEKTADAILDQDISNYPIMVIQEQPLQIGIPIVEPTAGNHDWWVNASTLEELATKNIIDMEKVDRFRQIYKDPAKYLCVFLITSVKADFVFLPRKNRPQEKQN